MVTQSDHQSGQKKNTRFDMKTWYLITMQSPKWPIHLMAFTSAMYLISKILRQMLWLHWQLHCDQLQILHMQCHLTILFS